MPRVIHFGLVYTFGVKCGCSWPILQSGQAFSLKGDVAQMARALDWQSRGRRFEPDLLHKTE